MAAEVTAIADEALADCAAGRLAAALDLVRGAGLGRVSDVPDLSGAGEKVTTGWVKLLHAAGWAKSDLGDKVAAREYLTEGLRLAAAAGLATSAGSLAYEVALVDFQCGQLQSAQRGCADAVRYRIAAGEEPIRPMLLLAGVLAAAGRPGEARAANRWALDAAAAIGDLGGCANALEQLAGFDMMARDSPQVVGLMVQAWQCRRVAGLHAEAARTVATLADWAKAPALAADPAMALLRAR